MSEVIQFEQHPDADQIGAFVEHALHAHERERMLGHLAVCPECRAIVALSLPSVETPAKPLSDSKRRQWWTGWALAWPVAAALAAVVVLAIYLDHLKGNSNSEPPIQEAELRQTAPSEMPKASPAPARILERPAPRSTRQGASERPSAASQDIAGVPTQLKSAQAAAIQAAARAPEPTSTVINATISSQEISEIHTENRNFAALAPLGLGASNDKTGTSGGPAKTAASGDANAVTARSSLASINNDSVLQSQQLKHRLPSGLPVLSMIAYGRRMIAIDTRNAVFLSADAGKHWKSIREPWQGRAVMVELASTDAIDSKKAVREYEGERVARPTASPAPNSAPVQAPVSNASSAAQQGSSLTGVVTDQTGAVVSRATVQVSNPETGESRSVQSSGTGLYEVKGLVPGSYSLKVVARGFESYLQSSIAIPAFTQIRADVRLTIGSETETVAVVADALAVQADSNVVSTLIAAGKPAPVFEITTDSLDHWTSTDGITWKRK